jgi:hypothetical protein
MAPAASAAPAGTDTLLFVFGFGPFDIVGLDRFVGVLLGFVGVDFR